MRATPREGVPNSNRRAKGSSRQREPLSHGVGAIAHLSTQPSRAMAADCSECSQRSSGPVVPSKSNEGNTNATEAGVPNVVSAAMRIATFLTARFRPSGDQVTRCRAQEAQWRRCLAASRNKPSSCSLSCSLFAMCGCGGLRGVEPCGWTPANLARVRHGIDRRARTRYLSREPRRAAVQDVREDAAVGKGQPQGSQRATQGSA